MFRTGLYLRTLLQIRHKKSAIKTCWIRGGVCVWRLESSSCGNAKCSYVGLDLRASKQLPWQQQVWEPLYLDTELHPRGTVLGMIGQAVLSNLSCPALPKWRVKRASERMELICSCLTFSYVKKPSTRLLAFPSRCIHLLRQSPLPRSLRTLHPPMRLDRGSGWSPQWMISQSLCRSQRVGVSALGWTKQRKRFTCVLTPCGCMDIQEKGLAGTVWLCCLHADSAWNHTRSLECFTVSACHCCLMRTLYPQQMLWEDQFYVLRFYLVWAISRLPSLMGSFLQNLSWDSFRTSVW